MKKLFSLIAIITALIISANLHQTLAEAGTIKAKAPYVSNNLKPIIAKYNKGDYTGAMGDLEQLLRKDKKNTLAKYYLALCYTQLGFRGEADGIYDEIIRRNEDMTLVYYARKARNCIDRNDGSNKECETNIASFNKVENNGKNIEEDDITKFIKSGQKIHPAAMDRIMQDKLQRQIQMEEKKLEKDGNQLNN